MATRHATLIWLIFAQFGFITSICTVTIKKKKMIGFTYSSAPLTRIIVICELSFPPQYFCSFTKTNKNIHTDAHGNIYAHNIYPNKHTQEPIYMCDITCILVNFSTVGLSIIVEICCSFVFFITVIVSAAHV